MFRPAISPLFALGIFLIPQSVLAQDSTTGQSIPGRASFITASQSQRAAVAKPTSCTGQQCGNCNQCAADQMIELAVATHTASAIGTVQHTEMSTAHCNNANCSHCQQEQARDVRPAEEVPVFSTESTNRLIAEQLAFYIMRQQGDVNEIQRVIEQSLNFASQSARQGHGDVQMSIGSDTPPPARPFYPPAKQLKNAEDMMELREMVKQNQRQVTMLARRIEEMKPLDRSGVDVHEQHHSNDGLAQHPSFETVEQNNRIAMLRARVAELEAQLASQPLEPAYPAEATNRALAPVANDANNPLRPEQISQPVVIVPVDDGITNDLVVTARHLSQENREPIVMTAYKVTDLAQPPYFGTVVDLVQYIKTRVDPENWDDCNVQVLASGRSSITLIISQRPSNHKQIAYLLDTLRMSTAEWIERKNSKRR